MVVFRHCDPRWPFLRDDPAQAPARWHAAGRGPAHYFVDTPVGAWAEFLRHEEIRDVEDLAGVRRSLWAVEIPDSGWHVPRLPAPTLFGDPNSWPACQADADRLRKAGHVRLRAPSAALIEGGAAGWNCDGEERPVKRRDGFVHVLFGAPRELIGWPVVESGSPPARVLPLVRHFKDE